MFDKEPNIDLVFRNGLKNLEVLPPGDVWENIPPVAAHQRKFTSFIGVAAGLTILFTLTIIASRFTKNGEAPDMRTQLAALVDESDAIVIPDLRSSSVVKTSPDEVFIRESANVTVREKPIYVITEPSLPSLALNTSESLPGESQNAISEETGDIMVVFPQMKFDLFTPGNELALIEKPKNEIGRFSLGASLSPAYGFTSSGDNFRLGELLSDEEGQALYSTGLTFAYKLSSRFSLQSGIGVASIGQMITGVDVFAGLSDYYAAKGDYLYSVQTASGTILSTNNDLYLSDTRERVGTFTLGGLADASKYNLDYVSSDIHQVFRYLEVPLVLRYKLIDRQIDINLSGGMAYGILVRNIAYANDGNNMVEIGHTEGVNTQSLSSQIGVGMEYNISKKMSFNVEPMFRYYLTSFSYLPNAMARPYSFGLFSGFFFRF